MRIQYYPLVLLGLFVHSLSAQSSYLEIGGRVGGANYLGDLTPSSFLTSIGETGVHAGIFGRFHFNEELTFRIGGNFGMIGADDARSLDSKGARRRRNLSFRSYIAELEVGAQYNLLPYRPLHLKKRFSPYFFVGIAIFRFNPQAYYQGDWHNLQPMGTEGQGLPGYHSKYKLTQVCIPFGWALKYAFTDNLNITLEYGLRKTFTDYLDDTSGLYPDLNQLIEESGELAGKLSWRTGEIFPDAEPPSPGSQRGDPEDLDWYIFSSISLSYNFIYPNVYRTQGKGKRSKSKCPKMNRKK